eukprot:c8201_g1_i1 orf=1-183(+)
MSKTSCGSYNQHECIFKDLGTTRKSVNIWVLKECTQTNHCLNSLLKQSKIKINLTFSLGT